MQSAKRISFFKTYRYFQRPAGVGLENDRTHVPEGRSRDRPARKLAAKTKPGNIWAKTTRQGRTQKGRSQDRPPGEPRAGQGAQRPTTGKFCIVGGLKPAPGQPRRPEPKAGQFFIPGAHEPGPGPAGTPQSKTGQFEIPGALETGPGPAGAPRAQNWSVFDIRRA